jgi:hypothetical protein
MEIVKLSCLRGSISSLRVPDTESMILAMDRGYLDATIIIAWAYGIVESSLPSLEASIGEVPDLDVRLVVGRDQSVLVTRKQLEGHHPMSIATQSLDASADTDIPELDELQNVMT